MSRKRSARRVLALPERPHFRVTDNKSEILLELLRELARQSQGLEAQLFHSQRDVARKYRVPLSLAAHIYRELEREGILRPVRGEGTFLEGFNGTRRASVRGIVGIASSLTQFLTQQDYRMFRMQLERELQKLEFAIADMLFELGEAADDVARRVKACQVDRVVWYAPQKHAKEVALRLHDKGISICGVADKGYPSIQCQYEIHRESALARIVEEWKKEAITSVKVAVGPARTPANEERIGRALDGMGMEAKFVSLGAQTLRHFVGGLASTLKVGIVILNSVASLMASEDPDSFDRLSKRCRVALIDGPVSLRGTRSYDAVVDLVTVDWAAVARRVADDISKSRPLGSGQPCVFEAAAQYRVQLGKYSQRI